MRWNLFEQHERICFLTQEAGEFVENSIKDMIAGLKKMEYVEFSEGWDGEEDDAYGFSSDTAFREPFCELVGDMVSDYS